MSGGVPRESLNLRVSPGLKRQIAEYATETGISANAAVSVLLASVVLAAGLRVERRRW